VCVHVWEKVNHSFVLGNCSNKDPCHKWMGSLVKWWITNKTDTNVHISKSCFFEVAHSIRHLVWGLSFPN
jgi:hypothetical protein